jgi:hypothetical protein
MGWAATSKSNRWLTSSQPCPAISAVTEFAHIDYQDWLQLSADERSFAELVWSTQYQPVDLLLMPRDQYVKQFKLWHWLEYNDVIMDGVLLANFDEAQLLDSLPDETVLTLASVHS